MRQLRPFIDTVAAAALASRDIASAAQEAARQHPALTTHFDIPESPNDIPFGLRQDLYFASHDDVGEVVFENRSSGEILTLSPDRDDLPLLRALFHCGVHGRLSELVEPIDDAMPGLLDELKRAQIVVEYAKTISSEPQTIEDGIYRLQHAGLLIVHNGQGLLFDPHYMSSYRPRSMSLDLGRPPHLRNIAIVLSHSHLDHVHIPTLMMFPPDTPIYLPAVPRPNLLAPDLAALLRSCGFKRVIPVGWPTPGASPCVQAFGSLELRAFPFYGEQPLANSLWRDPALRSWGNTYHVRTPRFSTFVLIDSGRDYLGDMRTVAREAYDALGATDFVLSNLRRFYVGVKRSSPFYITGLGHYWLALAPDQMAHFDRLGPQLLTLGPEGVSEFCKAARARYFLPYAHWWHSCGVPVSREAQDVAELAAHLGNATEILAWTVGDGYTMGAGGNAKPLKTRPLYLA
jgi:hypothetical protein